LTEASLTSTARSSSTYLSALSGEQREGRACPRPTWTPHPATECTASVSSQESILTLPTPPQGAPTSTSKRACGPRGAFIERAALSARERRLLTKHATGGPLGPRQPGSLEAPPPPLAPICTESSFQEESFMSFSIALLEWPDGPVGTAPNCLGEVDDPGLVSDSPRGLLRRRRQRPNRPAESLFWLIFGQLDPLGHLLPLC
jgi:hypothetical protein